MQYRVRVHENENKNGMSLGEFQAKLLKYLRKKERDEPKFTDDRSHHKLRTGLDVTLFPMNGNGMLEMLVEGNLDAFGRSISAINRIYDGNIEISYLNEKY
ncbi:hypothetical protein CMO83_00145 [Candidatus Woesearchaeota archaeon]|jgi:hypothetical protein|nr:hypothetical protein [Candidatus Woesearchaeota archaeon]|tara:strand:- start:17442 stop:17744 length:303 start_codon:yes stop_codon:yes gene_type:complete